MPSDFLSKDDLLKRWGLSEPDLDTLVEEGRLMMAQQKGVRGFSEDEVLTFEQSEEGKAFLKAHGAGGAADDGALLDLDQGAEPAAGDEFFDFTEDLETEPAAEEKKPAAKKAEPKKAEPRKAEAKKPAPAKPAKEEEPTQLGGVGEETEMMPEEEISESDMITEVVDVSGLEAGEEDILGDIIEDVGAGEEEPAPAGGADRDSTGSLGGEETMDMDGQDATSEITELEEETLEGDLAEGDIEATSDITQLEEESFEGEELEDILAGEEQLQAQAAEGGAAGEPYEEVDAFGPVATQAEPPIAMWIVVLLVLVIVVQAVAAIFLVEGTTGYATDITEALNLFKGQS